MGKPVLTLASCDDEGSPLYQAASAGGVDAQGRRATLWAVSAEPDYDVASSA